MVWLTPAIWAWTSRRAFDGAVPHVNGAWCRSPTPCSAPDVTSRVVTEMGQILLVYQGLNGTRELMQTVSSKSDVGVQRMRAHPQRFSSTKFSRGAVASPDDVERVATTVIREIEIQAYHSGCLCPGLSMLLYAWRGPKLRRSRTSQASQLLMSPARWSSSSG